MHRYVLAFPVVPGRSESDVKAIAEHFRSDPRAYQEGRGEVGITMERAYLQHTPMGDFVVAYIEAEHTFDKVMEKTLASKSEINQRFVKHVNDVHGVDLTQPTPGQWPETVAQWWETFPGAKIK